jgi:hypothetical protein
MKLEIAESAQKECKSQKLKIKIKEVIPACRDSIILSFTLSMKL